MQISKIFVVGGSIGYANWIEACGVKVVSSPSEADCFLFTGGVDVDPALYGEEIGKFTQRPSTHRDDMEVKAFHYAKANNKPMIGVCRGHQFLAVMHGGKLVQDSTHPYKHYMSTNEGEHLITNSMHHQQALLTSLKEGVDYELLAWADKISRHHLNGENIDYNFPENYREPEVIYFPETKSVGFQMHPECMDPESDLVKYCQRIIKKYL